MPSKSATAFEVSPPSLLAPLSMVLLAGVLPLGVITYTATRSHAAEAANTLLTSVTFILVLLTCLLWLMRRRTVTLENGVLQIRAAMYSKRAAVTEIDLQRARVVNLDERTDLRPGFKTNGYATFGYSAGHYWMRNNLGSGFCLLTQRQRVLWLPLRSGKQHILISLEHPQALLDAMQSLHP